MSINVAQYPLAVYDGLSPTRDNRFIVRGAQPEDFDQLAAEMIAVQTELDAVIAGTTTVVTATITTANITTLNVTGDINHDGTNIGFYSAVPAVKPTVTGSAGANAALASLLTELETLGLITDSSS